MPGKTLQDVLQAKTDLILVNRKRARGETPDGQEKKKKKKKSSLDALKNSLRGGTLGAALRDRAKKINKSIDK